MKLFYKKDGSCTACPLQERKKIRNDLVLVGLILVLTAAAALTLFLTREPGDLVTVEVNGELYGEYSLQDELTLEIRNGDGYNLLVIEDGHAYVKEADCPDGICSSHRPIKNDGESIICLPNKVVVSVRSVKGGQPDIIA